MMMKEPSKNEELRCVISDLCEQVRERDAEIERLTNERDEADGRAGAAERSYAYERESANARESWLRKAKAQWGVDNSVSFDEVWAEAVAIRQQLTEQQAHNAVLQEALERSLESFKFIAANGNSCGHSQMRIPDIETALAATSADSLKSIKNQVREECAEFVDRNLYDCRTYAEKLRAMKEE